MDRLRRLQAQRVRVEHPKLGCNKLLHGGFCSCNTGPFKM